MNTRIYYTEKNILYKAIKFNSLCDASLLHGKQPTDTNLSEIDTLELKAAITLNTGIH